ncbi:MAG: glycosyltransferase family 4 protein [Bacteroidetes bacterium]|nr:glycosyltransferase family 4 protein [Bacteroidota bacterium]
MPVKKSRTRVLMFGWEFPPVISGGLGVATLGLCKAMSPLADVKMIIPKSVPDFNIPNIELVGLNSLSQEQLRELFKKEAEFEFTESAQGKRPSFGPYTRIPENEFISQKFYEVMHEDIKPFEIDDLYAGDVIKKVMEFARISVQYGLKQKFDVIHAHDWMTFLPGMELKLKTGKPLVLHVHSTEYDRAGEHSKNWVYDLERRAMHLADRIIPVSHYTGTICERHYGVDPGKIMPVHNGIEAVKHTVKKSPFDEKLVIFFGRVTMQKGPEYFVEAAKLVLAHHPNVKFVMAGSGDLLRPMIEKTAAYGLGDKFYFTGFLNKVMLNELLAIADVYCMPSVSEPFGLSAVEAVQYGIPTIISKTSGVAEALHGSMQFDVWDVQKFAQYIVAALDYEGLRKSVVDANFHSLESITWENCALQVMNVYQSIFNENQQN